MFFSDAPVEKHFQRLVVGTTRCRTPVAHLATFEHPAPEDIRGHLFDLGNTAVIYEKPQGVPIALDRGRGEPSRVEGVGVEVLLEYMDRHAIEPCAVKKEIRSRPSPFGNCSKAGPLSERKWLHSAEMVSPGGFEPPTSSFGGRRPIR